MRRNDRPGTPRLEAPANPPSTTETSPEDSTSLLVPAAVAVVAGGAVLAAAIAFGAAEAAVGVGAAYLVYSAILARTDLSGNVAVRLVTGALFRPPPSRPTVE
jgi:hypothetical protein